MSDPSCIAEEKKNLPEQTSAAESSKGGRGRKVLRVAGWVIGVIFCLLILLLVQDVLT